MLIGYMRVSKSDGSQVLDLQLDALRAAGVEPARIYQDLDSGRKDERPGLTACLKALQPGNALVVWKLDRLGRDLKHLVNTIDDLSRRNIGLKVLAGADAQIDTTTANGRLVFAIFAALAEFEAELIRERTRAGLAAARARGRLGGRPRKMTKEAIEMAMAALADPQARPSEVARRLGITTTTLYVYLNGDGTVKAPGQHLLDGAADPPDGRGRRTTQARTMPLKAVPAEALMDLRRRLHTLAPHSAERRRLVQESAALYGISESTLYRRLRAGGQLRPA